MIYFHLARLEVIQLVRRRVKKAMLDGCSSVVIKGGSGMRLGNRALNFFLLLISHYRVWKIFECIRILNLNVFEYSIFWDTEHLIQLFNYSIIQFECIQIFNFLRYRAPYSANKTFLTELFTDCRKGWWTILIYVESHIFLEISLNNIVSGWIAVSNMSYKT